MHLRSYHLSLSAIFLILTALGAAGQNFDKELSLSAGATVSIVNRYGRVDAIATPADSDSADKQGQVSAKADKEILEKDVVVTGHGAHIDIEVHPTDPKKRIDLSLKLPERTSLTIQTSDGAVMVTGDLAVIDVTTDTGTVAVDIPTENLKYDLLWTESRPRFVSDIELNKVKEKAAGKFVIQGDTRDPQPKDKKSKDKGPGGERKEDTTIDPPGAAFDSKGTNGSDPPDDSKPEDKKKKDKKKDAAQGNVLKFTSARGIMLLNVPPNEVTSDLRERPLTNAAKAIVRSGDSLLMDAIRRASPKYFGEYISTLPPVKREPSFSDKTAVPEVPVAQVKQALVRVIDANNRTVTGLEAKDFVVSENGEDRQIVHVQPAATSVNLVLLLDVSGSIENYVNFIRKAARSFVNTVNRTDRISIVTFNDDVNVLSSFTTDKKKLSESLDTFDAGGATAYYDALAYTLSYTLRPMRGERAAIVVLTDGDDNRSFLSFNSLLGSIQESGAQIYPLYVPSTLIAAAENNPNASIDPLRTRYMGITSKAEGEGAKMAEISGGSYYQINQLNQIQDAYNDIVGQLRSAYFVTYQGTPDAAPDPNRKPRVKIRTNRDGTNVTITSVRAVK